MFIFTLIVVATSFGVSPEPTAEELVREARAAESWIHEVDSFYASFEGKWERTPQGLARKRAELAKQFPDADLDSGRFSDLNPLSIDTLVLAFDDQRLRKGSAQPDSRFDIRVWDGELAVVHEHFFHSGQEHYALGNEPSRMIGSSFISDLSWLRGTPHHFWWDAAPAEAMEYLYGSPEEWSLTGRDRFHDIECYVLQRHNHTLYIGVEDHLIHGLLQEAISYPPSKELTEARKQIDIDFGAPTTTPEGYSQWFASLSEGDQKAYYKACFERLRPFFHPQAEHFMMDYQEVAPGRWFPMRQGYSIFKTDGEGESFVSARRELRVVEIRLDKPLADELFTIQMQEGVKVIDRRVEPMLEYEWKEDMTDTEYQAVVDAHAAKNAPMEEAKARRDALVGQPAPPFQVESTWLNSDPLTWADLSGKVVILDFWAEWCGPCRNDFPTLAQLHEKREDTGIVILSVHHPGSDLDAIEKVMGQFDMKYPICIDIARENGPADWGQLAMQSYHVFAIPHAFVIDRQGQIAGHGSLNEVLAKAHELAAEPDELREE